ncbi:MAG: hypothetical protein J5814_07850 [Bacteroidaceae bacterium]|nr:hypothetical protein [Bacteroidaceae bacterium]
MKRFYLTLLLCLQAAFLMAQADSTIVRIDLDSCSINSILTPQVQSYVKKLILSGHMQNEDFPYVNDCPKLKILDLTDVITDSIPQYSLIKDKPLTDIYLPKKKTLFNANAVKNTEHYTTIVGENVEHNNITVHVPGVFPSLDGDYSSDYDYERTDFLWSLFFTVGKGNEYCIKTEDGKILSADRDTLFKFSPTESDEHFHGSNFTWNYYSGEHKIFDVKVVATHAFGFFRFAGDFYFSDKLETICWRAFQGILAVPVATGGSYASYSCSFHLSENPPHLEDPMFCSIWEVPIIYVPNVQAMHRYLESSCVWASTWLLSEGYDGWNSYNNYHYLWHPYFNKDKEKLFYQPPYVVNNYWSYRFMNTSNIVFRAEEDGSAITTDMDIEYSPYFMFIICWKDIVEDEYDDSYGYYYRYEEYRDTVYSPITDWEDLIGEIEIVDDNGNVCFSANKKRGKESSEHLSGVLTNVPSTEQGELKSRTNGRRFGTSPWNTQRISFDGTGIRPLKTSLPNKTLFDLQGRPVSHPKEGIYIQNGKKVLIK